MIAHFTATLFVFIHTPTLVYDGKTKALTYNMLNIRN